MNRSSISFECSVTASRRFRGCLLCGLAGAALAFAYPRVFPTGVTLYDPTRAYNTFVFFATQEDGPGQSFLIDMNGNEVHQWARGGMPARAVGSRGGQRRAGASAGAVVGDRSASRRRAGLAGVFPQQDDRRTGLGRPRRLAVGQ